MVDNLHVTSSIRKIIFENFNDIDLRFNNDQIFEILKQNEMIDTSLTIDDMEVHFKEYAILKFCVILHRILPHNGSNYLNQSRKFNAVRAKKKIM